MPDSVALAKIITKWLAIICFILAVLLLVWPDTFIKLNRFFKQWVSTASFEKELNRTRDIDEQLLKMRRVLGLIALALAFVFVLILFK